VSYFGFDAFKAEVNRCERPEQILEALRRRGVTHVMLNRAELYRRGTPIPFDAKPAQVFADFVDRHMKLLFKKIVASPPAPENDRQWVEVYALL
jgi:hypothetical protein